MAHLQLSFVKINQTVVDFEARGVGPFFYWEKARSRESKHQGAAPDQDTTPQTTRRGQHPSRILPPSNTLRAAPIRDSAPKALVSSLLWPPPLALKKDALEELKTTA